MRKIALVHQKALRASGPFETQGRQATQKDMIHIKKGESMSENKTKPTAQSAEQFLNSVPDEQKRQDSFVLLELMRQVTGLEPKMWGPSIIGFGSFHYRYESGREGESMLAGFSPRKQALTIYNMGGLEQYDDLLAKLGKHSTGGGCLYIKHLADVDLTILQSLIQASYDNMRRKYPG